MRIGLIGVGTAHVVHRIIRRLDLVPHAMAEMSHAMVAMQEIKINKPESIALTEHITIPFTLINDRIDQPFMYSESDKFRGKNKSKRKYPKPK